MKLKERERERRKGRSSKVRIKKPGSNGNPGTRGRVYFSDEIEKER